MVCLPFNLSFVTILIHHLQQCFRSSAKHESFAFGPLQSVGKRWWAEKGANKKH